MSSPDRILHNARIVRISGHEDCEALAIAGGRIIAAGDTPSVMRLAGEKTDLVDLAGACVLPGFIEAHGHPLYSALAWGEPVVDISPDKAGSFAAMRQIVIERAATAKPSEILWFLGMDPTRVADMREPTQQEMDGWAPNNPIVIQIFSFHSVYINSAAAELFSLDAHQYCDHVVVSPAGRAWKLKEQALELPQQLFYEQCGEERMFRELKRWLWLYADAGYTASAEIGLRPGWAAYYENFLANNTTPIRIRGYESGRAGSAPVARRGEGNHLFKVIGMKLLADGSLFVGNISNNRRYQDNETVTRLGIAPGRHADLNWTRQQLSELVMSYAAQGWQVSIHAQGDATTDLVLDCFEAALQKHPGADQPFRVEHCSLMTSAQIDRALKLGVAGSFYNKLFDEWGEVITGQLFEPNLLEPFLPSGTASRKGMRISYHCDSPMTRPDALGCIAFGVTRKTVRGTVIGAGEAMAVTDALRAMTIDAAYQLRMDDIVGSIEEGKYADLVVLAQDPRATDPGELRSINVLGTYLAGERKAGAYDAR